MRNEKIHRTHWMFLSSFGMDGGSDAGGIRHRAGHQDNSKTLAYRSYPFVSGLRWCRHLLIHSPEESLVLEKLVLDKQTLRKPIRANQRLPAGGRL